MVHHGARNRLDRDGLRQRGCQPVQAAGSRRERAKAGLARAERQFDFLTFGQFLIGARPQCFRFGAAAQRRLELERAIERLRGSGAEGEQIFAIVPRPLARLPEFELHHGEDTAAEHDRNGGKGAPEHGRPAASIGRGTHGYTPLAWR